MFSKNEVKCKYDKKCHNAQKFLKSATMLRNLKKMPQCSEILNKKCHNAQKQKERKI